MKHLSLAFHQATSDSVSWPETCWSQLYESKISLLLFTFEQSNPMVSMQGPRQQEQQVLRTFSTYLLANQSTISTFQLIKYNLIMIMSLRHGVRTQICWKNFVKRMFFDLLTSTYTESNKCIVYGQPNDNEGRTEDSEDNVANVPTWVKS